jgi:hypothetical protein
MNLAKNKKILIVVGLLVLGGFLYFRNKKAKANKVSGNLANTSSMGDLTSVYPTGLKEKDTVNLGSIDPTGAVYVLLSGKKYAFVSEKAFNAYGYKAPKTITKTQFDSIPNGGFVAEDGKVVNN